MIIPKNSDFAAFSMIVDINGFTTLVLKNELSAGVGQFVRDVLSGSIRAIEDAGGSVIGINGDAIFGILPDADSAAQACRMVAKDLNAVCEYLDGTDYLDEVPSPPTLKIGVEYGILSNSTISTNALGEIPFCIGPATVYCSRIIAPGEGNRCHVGPEAYASGMDNWIGERKQREVAGKPGEPIHTNYKYDPGEVWREGPRDDGEFYW